MTDLLRDLDKALVEQLDTTRYLFFGNIAGASGSYMDDSHTMDSAISDYASIERAHNGQGARGVRAYDTGTFGNAAYMWTPTPAKPPAIPWRIWAVAGHALEDMEKPEN